MVDEYVTNDSIHHSHHHYASGTLRSTMGVCFCIFIIKIIFWHSSTHAQGHGAKESGVEVSVGNIMIFINVSSLSGLYMIMSKREGPSCVCVYVWDLPFCVILF